MAEKELVLARSYPEWGKERDSEGYWGSRVREIRLPVSTVVNFLYNQRQLPEYVCLPMCKAMEGSTVLRISVREGEPLNSLMVLVYNPKFSFVRDGDEIPVMDAEADWWMYVLATQEEIEERRRKKAEELGLPVSPT